MSNNINKKLEKKQELLTIGQVSDIFHIHPDTLRNWEKDGILVPLRVGKRQDRKYRPEDIEEIMNKMGSQLTLSQLEKFLWKSADILRGKIDSADYKKYIFGLLFYKRISDVWDEEYKAVIDEYNDETLAVADYNHRFQVPKDCRWSVIQEEAESIGTHLNEIFDKLTNANSPKLDKIFDDLDFANKDRFPNEVLQKLINHFSQYNFGSNYISSDLLGDAYEYLIKQFAADAGKKGGEFYTPREVERVIINILKPHEKDHVYDPTAGSGGFLLEAYSYLKDKAGESVAKTLYLYGQEINIGTFAISKINMFLHGLDAADIRRGDTLSNPQFLDDFGALKKFDICVANFPYSIKSWSHEIFATNKYGRLEGYEMPPTSNADYAFILHIIKSLNENGRAGIVVPHGDLFRGGSEGRIREQIIKNDLIEAVISMPAKLFYGVGIPVAILILNRNKSENKKGKILFIEAENEYLEGKNQNSLRKQDVDKIVKIYDDYKDVNGIAKVVSIDEIEKNESSLNVRRYVDRSQSEDVINVGLAINELAEYKKLRIELESKVENYLKELDYVSDSKSNASPWKVVKLGDVCDFINGKTPLRSKKEYWSDGDIPWFTIDDIRSQGRIIKKTAQKITKLGFEESGLKIVPEETLLLCCTASIGEFAFSKIKITTNQQFNAIIPKDKNSLSSLYLFAIAPILKKRLEVLMGTTTFGFVSLGKLGSIEIPLPPLKVQNKISEIILSINDEISLGNKVINKLSVLKTGLIQDLLSGKIRA